MVDNQVVLKTVKRMISTGVDDDTIAMTLKGIGMSDAEIQGYLAKAKGEEQPDEESSTPDNSESELQSDDEEEGEDEDSGDEGDYDGIDDSETQDSETKVPASASKSSNADDSQNMQHAATHGMLEQHSGSLDEIKEQVSGVHQKLDSSPKISPEAISKIENLDKRVSGIEKEIRETKANTIALQGLLEKILETNRKTLLSIEKKK